MVISDLPKVLKVFAVVTSKHASRRCDVGRVAVLVDGHPEIFPVNYAVDERGDIFFRTDPGSKLDAVATAPMIAFEIDGLDEERHSGWSVLAVGPARRLVEPEQIAHARSLPPQPWAASKKANVVRLSPTKLSGRRIYRPAPSNRDAPVQ